MKKERKLTLVMNKVSISNLNNVFGGGANIVPSINFVCVVSTVLKTVPGEDCRTGLGNHYKSDRGC